MGDAPSGDFVFILGDLEPGHLHELAAGDHAEVQQAVDVTVVDFVRATFRLAVPASTPVGFVWEVAITVDGGVVASALAGSGRIRTLTDLVANVSKLSGLRTVGVRLTLREE